MFVFVRIELHTSLQDTGSTQRIYNLYMCIQQIPIAYGTDIHMYLY